MDTGLVAKETMAIMLTKVIPNTQTGLGLFIPEDNLKGYFDHAGSNGEYHSIMCFQAEGNKGYVAMLNSDIGTAFYKEFSEGMVKMVWEKYSCHKNILSQKIDIQCIPFPDNCFDVVIANHMLYHVPDLSKAISEVHRVLRSDGKFYAATNGNDGMRTYLHNVRKLINPNTPALSDGFSFSLQNGTELLSNFFGDVQSYNFEDSLHITETQDLIDWMKSTITISNYSESDFDKLYDYFENTRIKKGAIDIPKESGLFVCTK